MRPRGVTKKTLLRSPNPWSDNLISFLSSLSFSVPSFREARRSSSCGKRSGRSEMKKRGAKEGIITAETAISAGGCATTRGRFSQPRLGLAVAGVRARDMQENLNPLILLHSFFKRDDLAKISHLLRAANPRNGRNVMATNMRYSKEILALHAEGHPSLSAIPVTSSLPLRIRLTP